MAAGVRIKVPALSQTPALLNTLDATDRAVLFAVTELVRPLNVTVVGVVQLNSNGDEVANVTVNVLSAQGFEVL